MSEKKPDVIDAEFEVVSPAEPEKPKWRLYWPWQYDWYFDWRVFAVIALGSLAELIATLTKAGQ